MVKIFPYLPIHYDNPMPTPDCTLQLVDNFEIHRRAYLAQEYNEAQVRLELIDPFFEAIGWVGRLTDTTQLLSQDNRFIEVDQGFWVLRTWSSPDFDHASTGGMTVVKKATTPSGEETPTEIPASLTKQGVRYENE
jgi:hypothetical protein